jgi:condensin-2 complex subunit H2
LLFVCTDSLEEYLQELAGLQEASKEQQLSNSSNSTELNFAQAALILQNSSNVYSRKVEYLYSLVYKALDDFFRDKDAGSAASSRRKSADAEIDDFHAFDPHVEFLLLDDALPQDYSNKKINLPQEEDDDDNYNDGGVDLNTPNQSQNNVTRTRLSLGGFSVTNMERTFTVRASATSSSQQRALLGSLNQGTLRLVGGRCDIGENGVLLMPGSASSPSSGAALNSNSLGSEPRRLSNSLGLELQQVEINREGAEQMETNNFDRDDEDHDNDGPGFALADDDDDDGASVTPFAEPAPPAPLGNYQSALKRVTFADPATKKKADPWALLDPHAAEGKSKSKPLRIGKTYRLPPGIEEPPSQCVTGARTRRMPQRRRQLVVEKEEPRRACLTVETFRASLRQRSHKETTESEKTSTQDILPSVGLKGLLFGKEFAYIAKETAKRRVAARRAQRKQQTASQQAMPVEQNDNYNQDDDDDDDGYGGGFDFGGDDHEDGDNDNGDGVGNTGMSSLDDAFHRREADDDQGKSRSVERSIVLRYSFY